MSDMDPYWKKLVSTGLRFLQEQGNADAVAVIKNASLDVDFNNHDNWDGGINYWDLVFHLKYRDYTALGDRKDVIEGDILSSLEHFHTNGRDRLANVIIQPMIEQYIDWNAILPVTKESTIALIQEEQKMLSDVATDIISFKEDGVEEKYQDRHEKILTIADKAGFDYPVTANTLVEWWGEVKKFGSYAERREFISGLFSPLLKTLRKSEDYSTDVSFQLIATRSGTIQKAVEDAHVFIREGRFDSAVDRVHTALHGYLRQLLTGHGIDYGADDGLPALFAKLHGFYGDSIQPADVANRVKNILRSAGGMITAVNELRNNNTIAHPNGQLIQKKEAQLVIRLLNAVVDYIEDVENGISSPNNL